MSVFRSRFFPTATALLLLAGIATFSSVGLPTAYAQEQVPQSWRPVRGGSRYNLSGLALVIQEAGKTTFLVVHDNKKDDQERIALVTVTGADAPTYEALPWPDAANLPIDLESICAVPGQDSTKPPTFLALASAGKVYQITLDLEKKSLSLVRTFDLPNIPKDSNFEGLALAGSGTTLLAVWGHRGQDKQPALLHWGQFNLESGKMEEKGTQELIMPWPTANVRHLSDLKLDSSKALFLSSASDPGDDGPYSSCIYVAGVFSGEGNAVRFTPSASPIRLYRTPYHKIEALELVPGAQGGLALATDDENMGGWLYFDAP